ncbi:MAG: S8 family serine peptidase, partial [Anaerolineae bacterium]|nr:S8 family serine peptidase [Anaerolineae bacterium]
MTNHHLRSFWGALSFLFVCLALITAPVTAQTPTTPQTFKVIVGVNAAFRPEGELASANAVTWQRFNIANRQQMLLDTLRQMNISPNDIKRFQTIPYMALEIDAAGLLALQLNPNVTEIREDRLSRVDTTSANVVVNVQPAWNAGFNGAGYAVAILDTGVDFTHPSLINKRLDNGNAEACFSTNYAPDAAFVSCPNGTGTQFGFGASMPKLPPQCNDGCDHGTHVAGIAAGNGSGQGGLHENFRGVAPGAMLIGVNVFSLFNDVDWCGGVAFTPCTASYDSDQLRGLEHVYNLRTIYNIASVNMSLGGGNYSEVCDWAASSAYLNAVSNLKSSRIAVIAASGNQSRTNGMGAPACLSNVISVGATRDDDVVASFSNVDTFLDLFAPGVSITSTIPGGGYVSWPGTSMATPYVAGAWAIMRQVYPTASVDTILNQLKTRGVLVTDNIRSNGSIGSGLTIPRINIGNSIPANGVIRFATSSSIILEGITQNFNIHLQTGSGGINLPSPFTLTVNYGGTATRNSDYTGPDTLTFTRSGGWLPNTSYNNEAQLQINLLNDDFARNDNNETIIITFTAPNHLITFGSPSQHTITIVNTNVQVTGELNFSSSTYQVAEFGNTGINNIVQIPVRLTIANNTSNIFSPPSIQTNITYGGSASSITDYTIMQTSVTFTQSPYTQGVYTTLVPVTILARSGIQGDRSFTMTLQTPSHPDLMLGSPSVTTVTIRETDNINMTENE